MHLVETGGLTKRFGDRLALDSVDISVGRGVTGLLGANGAGKTTLLRLVLGLARPDSGTITVLGKDPHHDGASVRARIGWSAEHDTVPGDVRAQDLVRHLAEVHGLPARAALGRASDALNEVGLAEERFRPIGTMSTGQRQRVKLAMAIAHDPALVLLDEPTNGLDPMQRDDMLHLIRRIGTEFGLDVLVSSHLLGEVERICDSVIMLAEGRVVASGRLVDLRTGDDSLVVEVDGDAAPIVAALTAAGIVVEADGTSAFVAPVDDDGRVFDEVRDAVVAAGVGLRRMQRRTASLEDLFLAGVATATPEAAAE
ncbi:MAG: ABC transporter ATP-binding protein [Actinomycetota bacterium]|nr:ABC transporter ATP-binding protein [Actinomycetota bacterium]